MTKLERAVIDTAMYEYRRLVALGWDHSWLGGSARKAWRACEALAKSGAAKTKKARKR